MNDHVLRHKNGIPPTPHSLSAADGDAYPLSDRKSLGRTRSVRGKQSPVHRELLKPQDSMLSKAALEIIQNVDWESLHTTAPESRAHTGLFDDLVFLMEVERVLERNKARMTIAYSRRMLTAMVGNLRAWLSGPWR